MTSDEILERYSALLTGCEPGDAAHLHPELAGALIFEKSRADKAERILKYEDAPTLREFYEAALKVIKAARSVRAEWGELPASEVECKLIQALDAYDTVRASGIYRSPDL